MFKEISKKIAQDPWIKVVGMLQQNWAVIIERKNDGCGVFDEISFPTYKQAKMSLLRNGFSKYFDDKELQKFIELPYGEFKERSHPNGKIYSNGRFWH
jgi:hypothetical protein